MDKRDPILIAGGRGMVGSAIIRRLESESYENLLRPTRGELDVRDTAGVNNFFAAHRPKFVVVAAATVGGILANDSYAADFIYDNLMIAANLIDAAHKYGVEKLLFLGSTCVYPKLAPQPLKEEYLLTGPLEPTNEWYAVAKIAGIKLCQAYRRQHGARFIAAMPTNLYGPNDNFDLAASHVLPALIRKTHEAKASGAATVTVWGSGRPQREFLHVDDCADACVFLMQHYDNAEIINVGVGDDIAIAALAELVKSVVGFEGDLVFDESKPDGTPRKLVDVSRINTLGWSARIGLEEGIRSTYEWFLSASREGRVRF